MVSLGTLYSILGNPFYAGVIRWEGKLHAGKHPPMVSFDEFERVQDLLGRPSRPRPSRRQFAYTGMIRCGACGLSVTAEEKTNRYGTRYIYYHCTHRRQHGRCRERSLELSDLEAQLASFLEHLHIAPHTQRSLLSLFERQRSQKHEDRAVRLSAIQRALDDGDKELDVLMKMRLRQIIDDDAFIRQREELDHRRLQLAQQREVLQKIGSWIEPCRILLTFCNEAADRFRRGDLRIRRLIAETVCSNLLLADRMLSIEARKPFVSWPSAPASSEMRAFMKDVRTFHESGDQDFNHMVSNIRLILLRDKEGEEAA